MLEAGNAIQKSRFWGKNYNYEIPISKYSYLFIIINYRNFNLFWQIFADLCFPNYIKDYRSDFDKMTFIGGSFLFEPA